MALNRILSGALATAALLFFVLTSPVCAKPTTAAQAMAVVQAWRQQEKSPMKSAIGKTVKKVETFRDKTGGDQYYVVYLAEGGFVIVPADDLIEPIVAFSANGVYEPSDNNPLGALVSKDLPGRLALVRNMDHASAETSRKPVTTTNAAQRKWDRLLGTESVQEYELSTVSEYGLPSVSDVRVAPLIQSKWSQTTVSGNYCYNYFTPNYYPSGCVATAMSQLMRFYQLPVASVGTASYTIEVDGVSRSEALMGGDGAGGMYNWSQMPLVPSSSTVDSERQAIGRLLHDAGVAVNMQYEEGGSGSDTLQTATALKSTFGYTNAVKGYNGGSNMPTAARNAMVNPNLDDGLPILFGITGDGGHAIICDGYGYQTDTMYHHLNMGWAGTDDIWYNLPTIETTYYSFNSVYKVIYNIYTSGTGEIVSGRVTDCSGVPISGATVTATLGGSPILSTTTNNNGIYALKGLPSSTTYTVEVLKSGYSFTSQPAIVGTSSDYSATSGNVWGRDFTESSCAPVVISLETALDNTSLTWITGGNANWSGEATTSYDGVDAAQSGDVADNQSTYIQTTVTGPGTLSFYWQVSSESNYDYLRFYIDDVEQAGSISGTTTWAQKSFTLTSGTHTLKWAYTKDSSVSSGSDAGWVDQVVWTESEPARIIGLAGNLAFGSVTVGQSQTTTLTISNTGDSALTVSGISYPAGFSGTWSGSIAASGSQDVTVTFTPSEAIIYSGTITVNSDKTSGTDTIDCSGTGTISGGSIYSEAVSVMGNAKVIAAVQTLSTVDITGIVDNQSYNASLNGSFAVFERNLSDYAHGGNCTSDDLPDDPWPAAVVLRFAVAATGEVFVGAIGADNDVLTVLASGGGAAYNDTNDPTQIYHYALDWDQRANYLAWVIGDLLINNLSADGLASGGIADWNHFWVDGKFSLYNGFEKSIFQVYSGLIHQQADYSWYNTNLTTYDQMLREGWSPAEVRDANLTLQRNMTFAYDGVIGSAVETNAYGDNNNNEEIFLDGSSTGHQYDCGSIVRLFTNLTPNSAQINATSIWSNVSNHYRGAFVADSVSVISHDEIANGVTNPAASFDQNPSPIIFELPLGWSDNFAADVEFSEDWESGAIDGSKWKSWGSPVPVLRAGEGHNGSVGFDAAGDSWYQSGVASYQTFDLSQKPQIEFWAKGHSSTAEWQNIRVGWSTTTADGYSGTDGQPGFLANIMLGINSSTLYIRYQVGTEYFDEPWDVTNFNDNWMSYQLAINADGTVSFYRNGNHIWTNTNPVDWSQYQAQALVIDGRSYGAYQLVDDIVVTTQGNIADDTRIINLTGTLAFGSVTVGESQTATLTISNTGNSALTVSGISYPAGFSGDWIGAIAAGGSQDVTVTFMPTEATSYGGPIEVSANETSGTDTIDCSGTGTIASNYTLSASIAGTGGGSISSITPEAPFACTSGACAESFPSGTTLTLTATPDVNSLFSGWSGDCSGSGDCSLTMTASRSVAAAFTQSPNVQVTGGDSYDTLASAYAVVVNDGTIRARYMEFIENLILGRGIRTTLEGGYDASFTATSGYTTLLGTLTVQSGSVVIDRFVIK